MSELFVTFNNIDIPIIAPKDPNTIKKNLGLPLYGIEENLTY